MVGVVGGKWRVDEEKDSFGGLESDYEVGFGVWGYIGVISVDNESL